MQESHHMIPPIPAGDRPTRLPPLPPVRFSPDLKGKVFWEAMDPYGCQFLHQKLQERKPEDIQMIFSEVKDNICILMFDRLGSYVIQKLFEVCDEEQMTQLVSSVTADFDFLLAVCFNSQGSNSMKEFLKCLMTPKQISDMMSVFQQLMVPLVNHQIGYRVIGHCFDIFPIPAEETKPMLDVIADNVLTIATSGSESRLLMQILAPEVFLLESRPFILEGIIANVYGLSHHRFGHQVVQHVIERGTQDVVREIVTELGRYFAAMSMDKYASNVVMTLLVKYKDKNATQIIDAIITSPSFWKVKRNPYVIFVLQCAKDYSVGSDTTGKRNHDTIGSGVVAEKNRSQRSRARPKKLEDYVTSLDG